MRTLTQDKNIKPLYTVRQYFAGDETGILQTFKEVFQKYRSPDHWRWKFQKNPYSGPTLGLAESNTGEIVGHYGTIPVQLNFRGKKIAAAQSVDTIVVESFRKEGLFVKTAEEAYEQCAEKKIECVYGFPNAAAYPGRIKRLQWKKIAPLDHFVLKLSRFETLKRILKNAKTAEVAEKVRRQSMRNLFQFRAKTLKRKIGEGELVVLNHVPLQYPRFWEKIKGQEKLSLWKDLEYLRWRYDLHPENRFKYYTFQKNGEILAMVVVQVLGVTAHICECMAFGKNAHRARWLVLNLMLDLLDSHSTIYFRGLDDGFFRRVFRDLKWAVGESDVFCGRVLSSNTELQEAFYQRESWSVSLGDSDEV